MLYPHMNQCGHKTMDDYGQRAPLMEKTVFLHRISDKLLEKYDFVKQPFSRIKLIFLKQTLFVYWWHIRLCFEWIWARRWDFYTNQTHYRFHFISSVKPSAGPGVSFNAINRFRGGWLLLHPSTIISYLCWITTHIYNITVYFKMLASTSMILLTSEHGRMCVIVLCI